MKNIHFRPSHVPATSFEPTQSSEVPSAILGFGAFKVATGDRYFILQRSYGDFYHVLAKCES